MVGLEKIAYPINPAAETRITQSRFQVIRVLQTVSTQLTVGLVLDSLLNHLKLSAQPSLQNLIDWFILVGLI